MDTNLILIVDDELAIREMIKTTLELSGFQCLEASNCIKAHEMIYEKKPELVLLDWMLPGVSGIEFARRLRREEGYAELPIILLTAKVDEENKLQGFSAGVDDYITKPFSTRELIARVNAVLRRSSVKKRRKTLVVQSLELNPVSQRVTIDGNVLSMGPTEYRLLEFFMSHQDRAYTRCQLLDQVWGNNVYVEDRTVDVHIRRLRKALEPHHCDKFVQTVRGTGYRFSPI